ncbi:MAG: hypothetical protein U5N27_21245 [Rhizobium sp.]|nr:hypothetical protein [Rhizobium sp.]
MSAITLAEIEKGLRRLHRRGGVDRAQRLSVLARSITETFGDLSSYPLTPSSPGSPAGSMMSLRLEVRIQASPTSVIAATAKAYGLTVITANLEALHASGTWPVILLTALRT